MVNINYFNLQCTNIIEMNEGALVLREINCTNLVNE